MQSSTSFAVEEVGAQITPNNISANVLDFVVPDILVKDNVDLSVKNYLSCFLLRHQ